MKGLICISFIALLMLWHPSKSFAKGTDTIPPTLKLVGPSHDSTALGSTYYDPGYTVTDKYSPNITVSRSGTFVTTFQNNYTKKLGTYTLIYTAVDSLGNKASVTRYIKVYYNIPIVATLIGPTVVSICRYAVYKDLGYRIDTPAYSSFTVDTLGSFLKGGTSVPGIYNITYVIKDTLGNGSIPVTRTIIVQPSGSFGCTSSIVNAEGSVIDIKLFPNPASEFLNLDPGNQTITNIRMVNELGMLIFEQKNPEPGILQIPISPYKSGIYMVIISSENGIVVKRFLKN